MTDDDMVHLTEDELHDAADGTRRPSERLAAHLRDCARCAADVERIGELLAMTAALPRSVEPPADLWSGVRTRIRQQPGGRSEAPAWRSRWTTLASDPRWLAAAAVLLIVASSALTMLFTRDRGMDVVRAPDSVAPGGTLAAPVTRTVSDDYERLDRELGALLAANRDRMQPETIAKVERNLAIIDAAIAEIRDALAADPGNEALRQLLKASYGQKSALVRQVSAS